MKSDDFCPICNESIEVRCSGHSRKPFVDGKKYAVICQYCFETPMVGEYDEKANKYIAYEMTPNKINTPESLYIALCGERKAINKKDLDYNNYIIAQKR